MVKCNSTRPHATSGRLARLLLLMALLLWTLALTFLSLSPHVNAPAGMQFSDKFNHFVAYAVLTLLLIWTLSVWRSHSGRLLTVAWLTCTAFGALLEGLQWAMGVGRQWEFGDLLANTLGALAACVLFRHIARRNLFTNDR